MPTPDQLIYQDRNKDPQALSLPGVDPITPSSFLPNGPPDPGAGPPVPPPVNGPMETDLSAEQLLASDVPSAAQQPMPGGPALPPPPEFKTTPLNPIETPIETGPIFADYVAQSDQADKERMANNLEKANIHQQSAQEQRLSLQHSDKEWAEAQAVQKQREQAMDEAIAKGRAMSIDPQRYWNKQGTGANILSAISVGLGAFASGMTHGATGNPGLAMINQAIEHDMNAQKADIDNYWGSIKQQFQLDDTVWNRALATQNFRTNQRLASLKVVDSELAAVEAKSQNPVIQKGAAQMRMDLQMQQIGLRERSAVAIAEMQRKQAAAQAAAAGAATITAKERNATQTKLYEANIAAGMGHEDAVRNAWTETDKMYPQLKGTKFQSPGQAYQFYQDIAQHQVDQQQAQAKKLGPEKSIAQIMKTDKVDQAEATRRYNLLMNSPDKYKQLVLQSTPGAVITNPYGVSGTIDTGDPKTVIITSNDPNKPSTSYKFKDKTQANEARKTAAGLAEVNSIIDEMKKMRETNSGGSLDIVQVHNAEVLQARLIGAINQIHGGKLDAGERKMWADIIPDPAQWNLFGGRDNTLERLTALQSSLTNTATAQIQAYGGVPSGSAPAPAQAKPATTGTGGTEKKASRVPGEPLPGKVPAPPASVGPTSSSGPSKSSAPESKPEVRSNRWK